MIDTVVVAPGGSAGSPAAGVSWPSIIAGAITACAMTLVLLAFGTGLGLSMVYGFVKQSGGHIKIYSEPGQGTTIRIYLPRSRQVEDVETDVETGPATGGTETVLVVEDDEEVRGTVVDLLSDLGYRVLKAKDAQSALAIVAVAGPPTASRPRDIGIPPVAI